MLWIVGIWHMQAYLSDGFAIQNEITENITIGVLTIYSTGDLTLLNYHKQINSYLQITYKVIDL